MEHRVGSENRWPQHPLEGLAAYFAIPLLLGFAVGIHRAGFGRYFSAWGSVVVWEVHFAVFWGSCIAGLFLTSRLGALRNRPLALQLFCAALLGAAISRPIFWITYQMRSAYALQFGADANAVVRPIRVFEASGDFALLMIELYGPNVVLWTVSCLGLARYVRLPFLDRREGAAPAGNRDGQPQSPLGAETRSAPWLGRLKPDIGRELRWLKAEGHYLRVSTSQGTDLIHYRLSDAAEQLADRGLQVHRSYWVSFDALHDERTHLEGATIALGSGEIIPIGPSFLVKVRDALAGRRDPSGSAPQAVFTPHPASFGKPEQA